MSGLINDTTKEYNLTKSQLSILKAFDKEIRAIKLKMGEFTLKELSKSDTTISQDKLYLIKWDLKKQKAWVKRKVHGQSVNPMNAHSVTGFAPDRS